MGEELGEELEAEPAASCGEGGGATRLPMMK